jgi:hypothetical protein
MRGVRMVTVPAVAVRSPGASLKRRKGGSTEGSGTVWEAKMLDQTRVKQIMLDAILRHKEASTMSLRTAGAVVNAIYDALEKANVLAKIEKRQSPEKSG